MRRRDFIVGAVGSASLPVFARAQQSVPVVGVLDTRGSDGMASRIRALQQGLRETGLRDGENVKIVYRWADNRAENLPTLAAELVSQNVTVLMTTGGPLAAFAAKKATTTVPVVFLVGEDPVRLGLVDSIARPAGNLTGINLFANELEAKRLEIFHQLVPAAVRIAILVNSADRTNSENTLQEAGSAATKRGLSTVFTASTIAEIESAFAAIERARVDALFVGAAAFLNAHGALIARLAAQYRIPSSHALRESAVAGGLMAYGPNIEDAYRQCGTYVGRIINGAKPNNLPVMQALRFDFSLNVTTMRRLGLQAAPTLLALADEVVE